MSNFGSLARRAVRLPLRSIPKGTVVPVLSGPLRGARWVVGAGTHGCTTGAVVAFEPVPENVEALRRHVELNGAKNVTIIEAAVSDRNGRARFGRAANPAMGGLAEGGALDVETVTLDEIVRDRGLRRPDVIKVDVEGAEVQVLHGASRCLAEVRPAIVLSAHGWQRYEECRAFLVGAGYDLETAKDGAKDGDYLLVARSRRG